MTVWCVLMYIYMCAFGFLVSPCLSRTLEHLLSRSRGSVSRIVPGGVGSVVTLGLAVGLSDIRWLLLGLCILVEV